MELQERILHNSLYLSGDEFDITALAQRLGLSQRRIRDACVQLCDTRRLVKHTYDGRATRYSRPVFNKWLSTPWVTYHPPWPTPDELSLSLNFIYGNPIYD